MKKNKFLSALALVVLLAFTSCKKEKIEPTPEPFGLKRNSDV